MMRHRWLGACLLGISLAMVARADGPPRHVPLPPGSSTNDPETALAERLAGIKDWNEKWADKAKGLISEAQFKLIKDSVLKNHDKATDPKEVSRLVSQILGKDLSSGDQKLIESMIKNMNPDTLKGSDPSTSKPPDTEPPSTTSDPTTKTPDPSNPTPQPTSPTPAASSPSEEEQKEQEELARDLALLAKHFEGLAESMPDSPAMQKFVQGLAEFQANLGSGATQRSPSGDGPSLAHIAHSIRDLNGWLKLDENSMKNITPPRLGPLPTVSPGQFPRLLPGFGPMTAPSFGVGSLPGPRSVAIFVAVAAIIVLLGWRFRDYLPGADAKRGAAWDLGAWPVEPSKVSSRAELIRAFDYLSLRRFGQTALSWNHRTVAARLGAGDAELTRAAERLASAYERARYAPETSPLDEAALTEARSDLCYLAGAVGA